jgi:hypothetical protein
MAAALLASDVYDFMEDQYSTVASVQIIYEKYFFMTDNLDTSLAAEPSLPQLGVYTADTDEGSLNLMSAFRKDLFVSVTLPILGLGALVLGTVGASFAYTWGSYTRLDDAIGPLETATASLATSSNQIQATLNELKVLQKEAVSNREADRQQSRVDYEQLNALLQELKQGQAAANEVLKRVK